MLAFTGSEAGEEGGEDGVGGVEAGCEVGDCDADFYGGAVARAGYVHEAHFAGWFIRYGGGDWEGDLRFDHDVVACSLGEISLMVRRLG